MASDNELLIRINGTAKDFIDEIDKVKKKSADLEKTLTKTAKASALAFAGFAAVIAGVTASFAKYETALVGVGKTTNIEGKKLEKFGKEFKKLSSIIPISTNELLGIAQAAGQLGVEGEDNLLKFTETIAKLGVATDLSGEQAAIALTRILNVTNENIETIDVFGSVIVALGNNFAATESEIVRMTNEVARSTSVFGVTAAQAAALGTSLKSVGVQAQLGGSVVGKAMLKIQKAINDGGTALENLSSLTGIAGEDLKETFEQDATGVFQKFVEGLGNVEGGTSAMFKALDAFGLKGDEINKVLPVLAKNSELLGKAFATAAKETKNATALNIEAEKAFATLASEAQRVRNNFDNVTSSIGEALAPAVTELLKSVNGLLKSLSELDKETVSSIASFLKWGAIITASITTVATFALGLLKAKQILGGLRVAFTAGRIAAIGFTGALTGGLSLVLGFLPEIISGVKTLINFLSKGDEPKSLQSITNELTKIKKIREEIANAPDVGFVKKDTQLKQLDEEIKKLEEIRQAKLRASEDFGTGDLLIRPTAEETDFTKLGVDTGIEDQEIPFRSEVKDDTAENLKKSQDAEAAIIDAATQKRIDSAKRENEELKAIQQERADGATEQEIEMLQRRQEIEAEFTEAKNIKNKEERDLEIQNLKLKHAEEFAEIEEFEAQKSEREAERTEEKAALNEELRELDKEQRDLFNEEDQAALASSIDTQKEAEKKAAKEKIDRSIKEKNQFKQDEIKHGTEIAHLKKFFNSEELQGFKSTSNQLAQLSQSRNSTLKGIGKAAARVNAAIKTAEGAIAAYTSLAGIPIVGPALGAAAAGALLAFGVEQQQKISAAATGGFVPNTSGGSRDKTLMALEPEELIVPKQLVPTFTQSVGNPQSGDFGNDDSSSPSGENVLTLQGDLIQNDEFVAALATQLKDLQEFDNVRVL